jgi:hypothetical protein
LTPADGMIAAHLELSNGKLGTLRSRATIMKDTASDLSCGSEEWVD